MQKTDSRHKTLRSAAATLLLLLFVGYYVDVNFFVHSHIINGVTVVHSHIHRSSHHDSADGEHTSTQLCLIANLNSQLLTTDKLLPLPTHLDYQLITIILCGEVSRISSAHDLSAKLRAPPAYAC